MRKAFFHLKNFLGSALEDIWGICLLDWLKWFDFPYDPFFDKPLETDSELKALLVVGVDLSENIGAFVSQIWKIPQIFLIAGERGVGKSTAMYYVAGLLRKEGGFPVYLGLHHTKIDASKRPVEELKRDLLETTCIETIRSLSAYHPELFDRYRGRFVQLMKYLGYSFDSSAGFLPDIVPVSISYPDLEKHILELSRIVKNLGLNLLLLIDNLDKVKNIESIQTFLGSAFGQTFLGNLRKNGVSIALAVAPKFLEVQKEDRDLNYLSQTIHISPLAPNQAISLLEKRIDNCRKPAPRNPFREGAIIRICLSKRGITRDLLTEARNLCMSASNLELSWIDEKFVESGLVSFNPNRVFYDLMDSGEIIKDRIMKILDLRTLLNPEECAQAGSSLQSIAKGEIVKMPNKVHVALLRLGIVVQKPGDKRKYTFTSEVEQLLKACEEKGWHRTDFLGWMTSTEGHRVALIGTPGMRASQSIEDFGPLPEPTRSFVTIQVRNVERKFSVRDLLLDARKRLDFAKKEMRKVGRLTWDDIDNKTVYFSLYASLVNFLISYSKLYLACISRGSPRVRSIGKFDLVRSTKTILQREMGKSIVSWHRILRFRANILGLRKGASPPSHAMLKEALIDFEEIIREFSGLWREALSRQEIVAKPPDPRMQSAKTKLVSIASILGYSSERPEYTLVEINMEEEYQDLLPYPTHRLMFDVVREKQMKDEEGKVIRSFFIAHIHPIQKGRASSQDILRFIESCKHLITLVESNEKSLSSYWPRYYLIYVSLKGFDRGITATVTASEKPSDQSFLKLLNEQRLDGFEKDLVYTRKMGRTEGEFEELSSKSLEGLLRLGMKSKEIIREKHQKDTTVLLADMKEFTYRTEKDVIESAEAVQRLSDIFDRHVTEHGGEGTQTEGDSYIACFEKPEDAVTAALSVLEALEKYNATVDKENQILVRIGINSGTALFRKGHPFVGSVVNLASRAMREADPGKVVVTYYTKMRMKYRKNYRLKFVGARKLKGFPKPIDLFQAERIGSPK